jgi:hypothetical protein
LAFLALLLGTQALPSAVLSVNLFSHPAPLTTLNPSTSPLLSRSNRFVAGNAMFDMFLVMMLPIIIRNLFPIVAEWVNAVLKWERKKEERVFERMIE